MNLKISDNDGFSLKADPHRGGIEGARTISVNPVIPLPVLEIPASERT